jgi:hypothetical protein
MTAYMMKPSIRFLRKPGIVQKKKGLVKPKGGKRDQWRLTVRE